MNRAGKEVFVADFEKALQASTIFTLLKFDKINAEDMNSLRLGLGKKSVRLKVVKNTLLERVFKATNNTSLMERLQSELAGSSMIAYSSADPIVSTKSIWEWSQKENLNLNIRFGYAMNQVLEKSQIQELSLLPSREELYAKFLSLLSSAQTRFLYALQDAPKKLLYGFKALQQKKEQEST